MARGITFALFLVFLTVAAAIPRPRTVLAESRTWTVDDNGAAIFKETQDAFNVEDNTPPIIRIHSPGELESPGYILRASSITVVWWAYDESGIADYEIRLDDGAWANVSFVRTNTFANATFVDLSDGSHTIDIKAVDKAGNVGQERYDFMVDTLFLRIATIVAVVAAAVGVGVVLFFLRRLFFPRGNRVTNRLVRLHPGVGGCCSFNSRCVLP